jgi:hypothetical protein
MITATETVTSIFGYWPEFADARVLSLGFSVEGTVSLVLSYIDASAGKSAEISLSFSGVRELDLGGLACENVLDGLTVVPGDPMMVTLEPCIGLGGSFKCTAASVTGVSPNNSSKPTPLHGAA